ncbi:MAG: glycosyltransferase [Candidatus Gastranaerophilales bacterium]|nr:glycosyltransferase [Candidatus Gastranaerophilales bacterium]
MLTIIIKTNNSEDTISETLESVKDLGEIVVIDEHSTDDTILIAKEYKAKIVYSSIIEFCDIFKQVISEIENDWILFLEGNEVVPELLGNDILNYIENPKKNKNVLFLANKLFYLDKEIKASRELKPKLFKKGFIELKNNYSTELKPLKTKTYKLSKGYKDNKNCILKFQKQSITEILKNEPEKISIELKEISTFKNSVFFKPLFGFLNIYFIKGAVFDGKKGYIYSFYKAAELFLAECIKYEKQSSK